MRRKEDSQPIKNRGKKRLRSSNDIEIEKEFSGEKFSGHLHDFNWQGAGLQAACSMNPGERVYLVISRPSKPPIRAKAEVVWSRPSRLHQQHTRCGVYFLNDN